MNLKEYSLLAGAMLIAGNSHNQTKFYHDIEPDIDLDHGEPWFGFVFSTELDLNHDGDPDMHFQIAGSTSYTGFGAVGSFIFASAKPLESHQIMIKSSIAVGWCSLGDYAGTFSNVARYSNGEMINPIPISGEFIHPGEEHQSQNLFIQRYKSYFAATWETICNNTEDFLFFTAGLWFDVDMKSIPFKFSDGGNFYTGWIRLSASEGDFTIHDYAISLIPETSIIAGDVTGAVISAAPVPGMVTTTATKANVSWSAVEDATGYRIRYRKVGTPTWTVKKQTALSRILKPLTCGTNYEWQVQAIFDNSPEMNSEWCPLQNFSTASCRIGDDVTEVADVLIYPVPANDFITVKTISNSHSVEMFIELYDMQGSMMKNYITSSKEFRMNVSDLAPGAYLISVNNGYDEPLMQKIIISR